MPTKRRQIPRLGDYYEALLLWDSFLANKSASQQAHSLLCARLQVKEPDILKRLEWVANQRGITIEELQQGILSGEIKIEE